MTGFRIVLGCQGSKSVCRYLNVNMRWTTGIAGWKIAFKLVLPRVIGKNCGTMIIIIGSVGAGQPQFNHCFCYGRAIR